jgi:hypothetical protein
MRKLFFVLFVLVVAAFAGQFDLLAGHASGGTSGVQTHIGGDPFYDSFTIESWQYSTPSLDHLLDYGCVYVFNNYRFADPTSLGNILADYIDGGGTVVLNTPTWDSSYGIYGRVMTDEDYAPLTNMASGGFSYTNLGDYDDTHEFMDGVTTINNLYFWEYLNVESPATWVADMQNGEPLVAVNADYNCGGTNMFSDDAHYWTGDGWTLHNNIIQNLMLGAVPDEEPPYVDGMDPGDGDSDVPEDTDIIFHCKDELSRVDIDTIDFTARDTSLHASRVISPSAAVTAGYEPNRTIDGDLDIDDTDPKDVICTFDPTDDLMEDDIITCTVAAGLADIRDNEMEEDFVWSFDTGVAVDETTWGAIKAAF